MGIKVNKMCLGYFASGCHGAQCAISIDIVVVLTLSRTERNESVLGQESRAPSLEIPRQGWFMHAIWPF